MIRRSISMSAALRCLAATALLLSPALACAADPGYLRYRMPKEPATLDPSQAIDESSLLYAVNVFDGLVEFEAGGIKVVPAVAESWSASPDGRTYTFHLRKGVRFHNGREVTASDVVFSMKRVLDPKIASPLRPFLEMIDGADEFASNKAVDLRGVKAIDGRTVQVTLAYPYASFMTILASQAGNIVPADVYSDPNKGYLEHPVGCGPFRFESRERGVSMSLAAYPEHWKGKPGIPGVIVRFLDVSTAFLEFKAGNLDYDNEAPPGQRDWVRANMKESYHSWKRFATSFLVFNFDSGAFKNNLALRRAVCSAIDRDRIARVLQEGKDVPATRILPPGLLGSRDDAGPYHYDPDQARRFLADAGYPEGKGLPDITILTPSNEGIRRYAEAIQADLREIGMKVKLQSMDFASYQQAVEGSAEKGAPTDAFIQIWFADYPDPDAILRNLLHSSSFGPPGNFARYRNTEVDRLLEEGRRETDPAKRAGIYQRVEEIALGDACMAPIYFYGDDALASPRIEGLRPSPLGDYALPLELLHLKR